MAPSYSVIIPVYNGEKFIARAIESVLAQTYPAHEIVVINDGSKDNTEEVLKGFGERIRLKTIPNGGVSNARNQGISMATGDLIAFLDADDVWYEDKLEKQVRFFKEFEDVGFCCCNYNIYDLKLKHDVDHFVVLDGHNVVYDQPMTIEGAIKLLAALNFVGTASTVVVRKSLLDRVSLFNTSYKQAEDYELWLRCSMWSKLVVIKQVLVEKKRHESNLTNDQFEMNFFHCTVLKDFIRLNMEYIKKHNLKKDFDQAMFEVIFKLGDLSYNLGRKKQSARYYQESLSYCRSFKDFLCFLGGVCKKIIRFLSFGTISRKRFQGQSI